MESADPNSGQEHDNPDPQDPAPAYTPKPFQGGHGLLKGWSFGSLGGADQLYLDPGRLADRFGMRRGGKPVSRARVLVFDDYMKSDSAKNVGTNSNALLDDVLGMFDQLAIHVVAGDAHVSGTQPLSLSVWIQHSADGINWLDKRPGSPEIPATQLLAEMKLGTGGANVKIYVTQRDQGG